MEQPSQGEGGEGQSHGQGRPPTVQPQEVGGHGGGGNEQAVDTDAAQQAPVQDGLAGVPWLLRQHVPAGRLYPDGDGGQGVGKKVDKQQMYRQERVRQAQNGGDQNTQNARHITREQKGDGVFDVGVHPPAVDHRLDDGGEVIVGQDHGGSVLGHLSASDPHSHADVRRL